MKQIRLVVILMSVLFFGYTNVITAAGDSKRVRMKIASAFPIKLPIVAPVINAIEDLNEVSGGSIQVKFYNPGAIVPAFQIQEAVSKKQVEAGYGVAFYMFGKIPASALFTSYPFGPKMNAYMAWFEYGNGTKLYQEMYDRYGFNVVVFPIGGVPIESGGWFTKKITKVEDLKGMRLRWPGLGGKVLSKLGASISAISVGETFTALERGVIDGTELSSPLFEISLGFYKVAKYNYFPGWHQPSTAGELIINKDVWNSMSKMQQKLVKQAAFNGFAKTVLNNEAHNGKIIRENSEKRGVQNMIYPPEVLKAFQDTWMEIVDEYCAKDEFFKKVWDDLNSFMKDYEVWDEHAYRHMPLPRFK